METENKKDVIHLPLEAFKDKVLKPKIIEVEIIDKDKRTITERFVPAKDEEPDTLEEQTEEPEENETEAYPEGVSKQARKCHETFLENYENCKNHVSMYNSEIRKLEKKKREIDKKQVGIITLLCSATLIVFYVVLDKNMHLLGLNRDFTVIILLVPVTILFGFVYLHLDDGISEKEYSAYKWMAKNVINCIYPKSRAGKLPSVKYQKKMIALFPNAKCIKYKRGLENDSIEIYEAEVTAVEATEKKKEYLSFSGMAVYNEETDQIYLYSDKSIFPPFEPGKTIERAEIWNQYASVQEICRSIK